MLVTISILSIGFSTGSALVLLVAYLFFLKNVNKSIAGFVSCFLLMAALVGIQLSHLSFFLDHLNPVESPWYRFWLFLVAPMFFFFSRLTLVPQVGIRPVMLVHLLPLISSFFLGREIAIPFVFVVGLSYCLWLVSLVYRMREQRKRFHVEIFFFSLFSVQAVMVLILGLAIPYIDITYFYLTYANSIGFAFLLVIAALIVFPDLITDLSEVVKLSYSATTLTDVDIQAKLDQVEAVVSTPRIYQNDQLNLAILAEEIDLSSHQLSELINVHFGIGFSRFIRERRVEIAKRVLIEEPQASVLSISLDTGFKSQSSFYAAFKDITGEPPGTYRRKHAKPS